MNIKETIAAINRMQSDGVIDRYAIGGAVGATFYLEPVATLDVEVFAAEHLAAIALQTGRAKDKARLLQFIEAAALDPTRFQGILARHGLVDRWHQFERQFLSDTP